MMIPLSEIHIGKRGRKKYEKLEELGKSLKDVQLQNIVIRRPRQDEIDSGIVSPYILVAGGRRVAAGLLTGIAALRAELLEDMPEWKQKALELEENIQREEMDWVDIVEMKLQIHELYTAQNPQHQQTDTAKIIGEKAPNTNRDLKLAAAIRLNPELKQSSSKKAAVRVVEMQKTIAARQIKDATLDFTPLRTKLVTADATDFLKELPAESVDLLFSDPPWGIDYYTHEGKDEAAGKYDDSATTTRLTLRAVIPEMIRVTKETGWIVLIINWEHHFYARSIMENQCLVHNRQRSPECNDKCLFLKCEDIPWLWFRPNSRNNPMHPELHAQNQYELILVCNRGQGKLYTSTEGRVPNVLVYDTDYSGRIHAMQKPEGLLLDIINRTTLPTQLVVDPFAGSFSTPRAAARAGRDFLACDLNPHALEKGINYVAETYGGEMKKPRDKDEELDDPESDAEFDPDDEDYDPDAEVEELEFDDDRPFSASEEDEE